MPTSATYEKLLVWFRRDLRSYDNAALYHALKNSEYVYCVFIYDTTILDELGSYDRRVDYIHSSVQELSNALTELGGELIVRTGNPTLEIPHLAMELGVGAVYFNHDYEPSTIQRDADVKYALHSVDCDCHTFKDHVIFEKLEVITQQGKPFSVFTPYKRAWLNKLFESQSDFYYREYPVEQYKTAFAKSPDSSVEELPTLAALGFESTNIRQIGILPGMSGAQAALATFKERIANYHELRNTPSIAGTSWMSTHLRFGTVSTRELVRLALALRTKADYTDGVEAWLNELIWRDFYVMILFTNPHVVSKSFKPAYDRIVWEDGDAARRMFKAWCEGRTGFPLVDAAMKQLLTTGYMHNRLRMVVGSFLTKDLGLNWRWGEQFFAETLNDYDLSANNGGWQWASSSGADAAPYFRIFSPVRQSERFDADGAFIRRFLPELAKLSNKQIHAPWLVSTEQLVAAGVIMGETYPWPIVSHDEARKKTLARYEVIKGAAEDRDWD